MGHIKEDNQYSSEGSCTRRRLDMLVKLELRQGAAQLPSYLPPTSSSMTLNTGPRGSSDANMGNLCARLPT